MKQQPKACFTKSPLCPCEMLVLKPATVQTNLMQHEGKAHHKTAERSCRLMFLERHQCLYLGHFASICFLMSWGVQSFLEGSGTCYFWPASFHVTPDKL